MLDARIQLSYALAAFQSTYKLGKCWSAKHLSYFNSAGILSMNDLQIACRENTLNTELKLVGIPPLSDSIIQSLRAFLPGPQGIQCFQLAYTAAQKVQCGTAETDYVHRPAGGGKGRELKT